MADQEEVRKIERQLKNRFPIGSHVSEQRIIQDFLKQVTALLNHAYFFLSLIMHSLLNDYILLKHPVVVVVVVDALYCICLSSQNYDERTIQTVLHIMLRRGELEHRLQRKVLYRTR